MDCESWATIWRYISFAKVIIENFSFLVRTMSVTILYFYFNLLLIGLYMALDFFEGGMF